MSLSQRKTCCLVSSGLLLICLATLGGRLHSGRAQLLAVAHAAEGQNQLQVGSNEKLRALLLERYDILKRFAESYNELLKFGRVEWSDAANATVAMFHAEADLCLTGSERIKVFEKLVETLRGFEASIASEAAASRRPRAEADKVKVARLEAQIRLEQLRLAQKPS